MSSSPPLACTLNAADHAKRAADLRSLGRDALVAAEAGQRQVVLRFRSDPDIRERVEHLVAGESQCCGFLTFDVADEQGTTALTVRAPAGGEATMHDLASSIASGRERDG
jgi:hypothetical protein